MKLLLKILLPLVVISSSIWVAQQVIANKPKPQRQFTPPSLTAVEAIRLSAQDYQVRIKTQGTVSPRTESTLIAQVSGRIVAVSSAFREGGFFEQGDILLSIDPRDYEIAVTVAESQVAQARLTLEEEQARVAVAKREWQRLTKKPTSERLALRKPQLAATRAALASAEAQLARARLDLERSRITAPYAGRVLEQNVDVGQYVPSGTVLARVYAVDYAEIRLPLSNRQLEYVNIPEQYRGEAVESAGPPVTIKARIGHNEYRWQGTLVRSEGAIDTRSRQLFVVAQIKDPYGKGPEGRPPLRVGQFVTAEIEGRLLHDVFIIPRTALRENKEVLLVNSDSRIERRAVTVTWSNEHHAVITAGLHESDVLALTPLSSAADGARVAVTIDEATPPSKIQ